jgi:GrpB-like predicted nucleotidyltransferase (UPF0157 family)
VLAAGDDPGYRRFGELYRRVTTEVKSPGETIHFVRYNFGCAQFAALEVEDAVEIPKGMAAWELSNDAWTIRSASGDIAWQAPLTWLWRTDSGAGRRIGEFSSLCPHEWGGGKREFEITGSSYLRCLEPHADDIELVDSDPTWPEQYKAFAACLVDALGSEVALRVEHYGSTAIAGIPAKPVIDVLVEAPSFDIARRRALPVLDGDEWEYWWYGDHMVFIKRRGLIGPRTHHLHIAPGGHRLWDCIAFRDYLRAHPDIAGRYASLKRELAAKHAQDRERYTDEKKAFVRQVTDKALCSALANKGGQ